MKYSAYILLLVLVLFSCISAEGAPKKEASIPIAVLDLSGSGVSAEELTGLTNRLRMELFKTGYYTIVERSIMAEILEEQGFQQTGCTDSECAVELGKMLNVEKIIAGSVDRVGEIYATSIRMIDVESGKIDRIASDDCINCSVGKVLIQSIGNVAVELATEKETQIQDDITLSSSLDSKSKSGKLPYSSATPEIMERFLYNSIQYYDGAIRPWRFKGRKIKSFRRIIRRLDEQNPHARDIVKHNKRISTGVVLTAFVATAPIGIPVIIKNKRERNVVINKYNEIIANQNGIEPSTVMKIQ